MALRGLLMDYGGVLTDGPELAAAVAALFDAVVLGPALGVRKPDPEVFRRAAAQLGLTTAECVVVDDHPANLRGARSAGAVLVRHLDAATTVEELDVLFGS